MNPSKDTPPPIVSRLIKPSVLAYTREARRLGFSWFDWLHGYVYARWTYLYIGIGTRRHPLARWVSQHLPAPRQPKQPTPEPANSTSKKHSMADTYHGKVVPLEAARQLVQVNEEVRLENLEKIIPYPTARDIVLHNPDHLVLLDCPCRMTKENPCLPMDVCLIVGEPFASFVIEHQSGHARWVTPNEALAVLEAEDRRGHVHHAFFKDVMLDRFYAICNCCSCCCAAIQSHQNGSPMLASSGYVAVANSEICFGCGYCGTFCQFQAISYEEGYAEVNPALCMGCGVCVNHCDEGGLSLQRAPARGEPLEIVHLMEQMGASYGNT
ncbi:MAG: 4Fe-4S ferredoxin [Anaerolineales bacterium]|jgi:ferredoxin|nr:4Fe-4S ferredoxin [Anaerolineales bacterium]